MPEFRGHLRMEGDSDPSIAVEIDIDSERIRVMSNDVEIADWVLEEVRVDALTDGFHVRAEGDVVILQVADDGRFALELGLRTAHPALRQKMAAILREGS